MEVDVAAAMSGSQDNQRHSMSGTEGGIPMREDELSSFEMGFRKPYSD